VKTIYESAGNWTSLKIENLVRKTQRYYLLTVTGPGCRYCLNKGAFHNSNQIRFEISSEGIVQRCKSPHHNCFKYRSIPFPLDPDIKVLLFFEDFADPSLFSNNNFGKNQKRFESNQKRAESEQKRSESNQKRKADDQPDQTEEPKTKIPIKKERKINEDKIRYVMENMCYLSSITFQNETRHNLNESMRNKKPKEQTYRKPYDPKEPKDDIPTPSEAPEDNGNTPYTKIRKNQGVNWGSSSPWVRFGSLLTKK